MKRSVRAAGGRRAAQWVSSTPPQSLLARSLLSRSVALTRSALTMIVSSLRPTRRPLANVLQALLRELAMEWQLECGRTTERGGDSRLSCSSPHNKTTLRSASSSFPFLLFTQFHCTVRPVSPHAFAPSFAFTLLFRGSVFAGKTAVERDRRWRSRKHKCTLTPSFHSGQSR